MGAYDRDNKKYRSKKDEMQVEKEKLESVKRADAAVKTMHDLQVRRCFIRTDKQCPEVSSINRYFHDREGI